MHRANTLLLSLLLAAGLWGLSPDMSSAADFRGAETIVIGENETVRDDLYAAASAITVEGSIDGDLFAAAQTLVIRGRITGSVFAAAQQVEVSGVVDGDLRVAGQIVRISRAVGGDLIAAAQTIEVAGSGAVARDALLLGQAMSLDGPIQRSLWGAGEEVRLNSTIGGNVEIFAVERLVLGPHARLAGDLAYESSREAARDPGAEVRGRTTRREPRPQQQPEPADRLGGVIFGILAITALGAAILAIAPRGTAAAGRASVEQALLCLGWGFGLLVGTPVLAVMLLFTLVGIPLAFVILVLYGVLLYTSQAIVALGVGRLLLSQLRPVEGYGWSVVSILVGALIVGALRSLPVVDGIATLVVLVLGLGGMGLAYVQARTAPPSGPPIMTPRRAEAGPASGP